MYVYCVYLLHTSTVYIYSANSLRINPLCRLLRNLLRTSVAYICCVHLLRTSNAYIYFVYKYISYIYCVHLLHIIIIYYRHLLHTSNASNFHSRKSFTCFKTNTANKLQYFFSSLCLGLKNKHYFDIYKIYITGRVLNFTASMDKKVIIVNQVLKKMNLSHLTLGKNMPLQR